MGITAKFSGKCVLCGSYYPEGAQVDRAPGFDKGRAHVECINQPAQPAPRQAPPAPAPANVIAPPGAEYHGNSTTHLVSIRSGLEVAIKCARDAAESLDAMREGLEGAMVGLDHVLAARQEAARGGRR